MIELMVLTSIWQSVKLRAEAEGRDEEQVLRARVICAVDDGAGGKTEGHAELGALCTTWKR